MKAGRAARYGYINDERTGVIFHRRLPLVVREGEAASSL